ncbi:MAG: GNAT family N-acetyltransferase [Lachnospiraceae bacterium]|nr:GNAT family N-acetyltransferase [Lachnospiraceae bacterium]
MKDKITTIEELASNAHVALNVQFCDGWVLKFSEGHTGRANSVNIMYPSQLDALEKIKHCEECYEKQNIPCRFKLTDGDEAINELLVERGYVEVNPSDVMSLDLSGTDIEMPNFDVVFYDKPVEEWLVPYFAYEGFSEKGQDVFRRMLDKVVIDTTFTAIRMDGKIVAMASSAGERGMTMIQNVVVSPDYRGRGLGKAICQALLAKVKEQGYNTAYLQVVKSNTVALNLYNTLGFKKEYLYWYMNK